MAFRDDDEAARLRTRALERELEDKDAALEDKDAELRALRAQLERATSAQREETSSAGAEAERRERADGELDEVKRRGRERAAAERVARAAAAERDEAAKRRAEDAERERMALVSVSRWGEVPISSLAPLAALPTFYLAGYCFVAVSRGLAAAVVAAVLVALMSLGPLGRRWARRQWRLEQRWAEQLPYTLAGYPELLDKAPASAGARFLTEGDRHQALRLEISLRGGCDAEELERLLTSFDSELTAADPFVQAKGAWRFGPKARKAEASPKSEPGVFHRPSPVTIERSKSGFTSHANHNRAVLQWVRRLEREVLAPLHERYGIEAVSLALR